MATDNQRSSMCKQMQPPNSQADEGCLNQKVLLLTLLSLLPLLLPPPPLLLPLYPLLPPLLLPLLLPLLHPLLLRTCMVPVQLHPDELR
jgi:hypothetical protein